MSVNYGALVAVVVLALAVAAVAVTFTRAKVSRPWRQFLERRAYPDLPHTTNARRGWTFVCEAFQCPYCLSHWLALAAVGVYRPIIVSCGAWPIDLLVSAMAIVALSAWCAGLIFRALSTVPAVPRLAGAQLQSTGA